MVKLGLVIGSVIPRPLARPRVKVVLPAPTSPISSMMMAFEFGSCARWSSGFEFVLVVEFIPCAEWFLREAGNVKFCAKLAAKESISCSDLITIV